jgi:import inner membrane translocase subunit TIM8
MNLDYCLIFPFTQHMDCFNCFQQEKARAMLNELVGKLTSVCWDKCIGTPGSKISSSESSCLTNCAQQFMETSALILRRFGGAPQ